jgi:hypothetical protein
LQRRETIVGKTAYKKLLDDIIGSNNTIPVKHFENNLKKYFENIFFRKLEKYQRKGKWKVILLQSIDNFTKSKQTGNPIIVNFFPFPKQFVLFCPN